jgi:hypothetical protein
MQLTEREGIKKSFRSRSQALKIELSLGPSFKERRPGLGLGLGFGPSCKKRRPGLGFGPSCKERRPGLGFGPSYKERRPGGGRSPNSPVPFEIRYGSVFARPWQRCGLSCPSQRCSTEQPPRVCLLPVRLCVPVCDEQPHQRTLRRVRQLGRSFFNF